MFVHTCAYVHWPAGDWAKELKFSVDFVIERRTGANDTIQHLIIFFSRNSSNKTAVLSSRFSKVKDPFFGVGRGNQTRNPLSSVLE